MSQPFRGIFPILQTPFNAQGDLVWDDFERLCDFIARSGAHGFVWPVMASEFTVVSYPERMEGVRRAVDVVAGRIPVVIGVADTTQDAAVRLAAEAGRVGADAVITARRLDAVRLLPAAYDDLHRWAGNRWSGFDPQTETLPVQALSLESGPADGHEGEKQALYTRACLALSTGDRTQARRLLQQIGAYRAAQRLLKSLEET